MTHTQQLLDIQDEATSFYRERIIDLFAQHTSGQFLKESIIDALAKAWGTSVILAINEIVTEQANHTDTKPTVFN